MKIRLSYGKEGLDIEVPDHATVVEPMFAPGIADEAAALREAMRAPIDCASLHELVRPGNTVCIVHSDITRPMPNDRVLPVLIARVGSGRYPQPGHHPAQRIRHPPAADP